jgi:tetratricopeptide (TPR) repeat protein
VDVESVSLTLVSVEEILKSNPRLESAMYHKAECLVLIGRYKEAFLFIDTLRSGVERSYILAEGLWRSGRVEDALEVLQEFVVRNEKCLDLKTYVERLQRDLDIIQRYMDEEGEYGQAVLRCSELLESLSISACSGLYRRLLRMRADAHCCRGSWLDAKTDLNLALSIYEEDVDALRSKADVLKQMGAYTEYFLSLQRLKTVSPNLPGLSALIMDAARLSLKYKDGESMNYADTQTKTASGPAAAFDVLGVSHGVPLSDVRKAYLKLAATWHPDKWSSGTDDELKKAEETFKVIQKAYNDICDSMFL